MKAAVMTGLRAPLEIQQLPDPAPGPADAVVRVEACGICRSDWHLWQGDWSWAGIELPPIPFLEQATPPGLPFLPPPGLIVPPSTPETPPKVPAPQSALPEPGTWATMFLGFALIGWQLRRRGNPGGLGASSLR